MASSSCAKQIPIPMKDIFTSYIRYPTAMAEYEEVKNNPKMFMATMEKFHSSMGTKFMIPIIGGRELDLHRLFVEVTQRGGLQKILGEKRWKEVTALFNFPSTATNASFVLRKYYMSLLQHYEQLYFFKAQGWNAAIGAPLQNPSGRHVAVQIPMHPSLGYQAHSTTIQQQKINFAPLLSGGTKISTAVGPPPVMGVIDGKFDNGYLVTVTMGSENFQGVLYQAATEGQQHCQMLLQHQQHYDSLLASTKIHGTRDGVVQRRRRRRKKNEIKRRDPDHPKPNRSGYNFFFAEQHARLKPLHPKMDKEISRMIGELWNKLKDGERSVYQEIAMKDKERYRSEMEGYRERLRTRGGQRLILSEAVVPVLVQQWQRAEQEVDMVEANDPKLAENGGGGRGSPNRNQDNDSTSSSSGCEVGYDEDDEDEDDKNVMAEDFDTREASSPIPRLGAILSKLGMEASSAFDPSKFKRILVVGEDKMEDSRRVQKVDETTMNGNNNFQNFSTEANQDGAP